MTPSEPVRPARALAPSPASLASTIGITVYGCGQDEAAAFLEIGPRFGVRPTVVDDALSELNAVRATGNRCISVDHKSHVPNSALLALSQAGVSYVSTRSIGRNHIDEEYAERVGLRIGTVAYSPDSVADYTLMLMLMALRNAKSVMRRAQDHDYRLNDLRGRELRDLVVGIVGTGRIGAAVIQRLRGFGCRILAYDKITLSPAQYVPLDELIRQSDIVSLHTPLNPETHHLLNRQRIERMRPGALVVNTGRGALLDTEALISGLESGHLGGAALDVLEGEEGIFYSDCRGKPPGSEALLRLQRLPNVLISPHTAFYTEHALDDVVQDTILNCLTFEREMAAWTG